MIAKRRIGDTRLAVSELGLGGAAIGGLYRACPRETAMATLETAWEAGIRYFDTAPFYGMGLSERRIGDFLGGKPRGEWVLSSKVGRLLEPARGRAVEGHGYAEPLPFLMRYDYSYDGVMRSVEASHARLGLDRIDILYVHDIGAYTHGPAATSVHLRQLLDSGLKALEALKSAGAIGAYGLGVNEVDICTEVLSRASLDCILLAGRYTLLDRSAEAGLLDLCAKNDTSLVIGGAFNSGILATGARPGANFDYGPASPEIVARVTAMEAVAESQGLPLAAAALAFPLRSRQVASLLIGAADPALLRRNLDLAAIDMSEAALAAFSPHAIG